MLRTNLACIEQEIRTMQSHFAQIEDQWSDRVSAVIHKQFRQDILAPCHDYYSRIGGLINEIERLEAEISRIASTHIA